MAAQNPEEANLKADNSYPLEIEFGPGEDRKNRGRISNIF
jgi:hypothetical protein